MGDYVDRFGKGRTFTPDQLERTAHRLEQQPKGKPVRVFECCVCGKLKEFAAIGRGPEFVCVDCFEDLTL